MIANSVPALQQHSSIEVIDVGACRTDLTSRRELKFVVSAAHLDPLRRLLEGNGRRQIFNGEVSLVHSLYFDDATLSACRANLNGLGRRRKLRLRWYDRPLPGNEAFLEIKWRDNRTTGKHRLCLRSGESLWTLPYRTILAQIAAAVPERYLPTLAQYSEPTLLVEYRREHFIAYERPLRVTLDYGVVYYDQTGKQRIWTSLGRRHEGLVVVEGKLPAGHEQDLRSFLHPFAARVDRCSKYVHGCQMLGLVRGM